MLLRQPLVNRRRQKEPGLAVDRPEVAHRRNVLEKRAKRAVILSDPRHGVKSDRLLGDRPHPVIRASAYRLLERAKGNERYLTSVLATADSNLTLFDNPIVQWTTETSQWRMCDIMCSEHPVSVYLSIPASDEDVLIPLLRIMMTQFLKTNTRHLYHDNRGRKKRHDCLIVGDEFPALKRMSVYETMMKRFSQYRIKSFKTVQSDTDLVKAS